MATPTTLPNTPNGIPGNLLPDMHGTGFSHTEATNEIIADLLRAWTKIGIGASTPVANSVFVGNGTGTSAFLAGLTTPYLANGAATSDKVSLTPVEVDLAADVLLNNAATFFAGPAMNLAAGTWLIVGNVHVVDTGQASTIVAKLWDGTTVESSGAGTVGGAGFSLQIGVAGIVSPVATTTYSISCRCPGTTTGKILAATSGVGQGNNASHMRAIRIA